MCGIAGILSRDGRPVPVATLESMCDVMVHRGPDNGGVYVGGGAGLGMRRLSIIDLETGHQPVRNEDGTVWVVLNGEIYNYRALRAELEQRGHRFSTASDTETIVHLYEDEGPRCVEKLRGMFAFAVWDERRHQLLIARDRLGIKPLYYGEVAGRLVFASELKALLQVPEVSRTLSWPAVAHLFTFLTTPATQSILRDVHKLGAGHRLIATADAPVRIEPYWDIRFEPDRRASEADLVDELRARLEESVRLHMISDVPLGAFLSGGVDSSAVVATMSRLSSRPVKTFSIGFADEDYDELQHARLVARRFRTDHHELVLDPDVVDVIEDLAWFLDEPFGDSSAIPTYIVSKLASEHVTVALTGDGGDELFAGYEKYGVERRERRYERLPQVARRALGRLGERLPPGVRGRNWLRHMALGGADRYLDASTLFSQARLGRLFRPGVFTELDTEHVCEAAQGHLAATSGHWLSAAQYLDLKHYLPLDILTKVDRMSMAHSIETRVPLLDHRLVEFAATIPPELQMRRGATKALFKRAMRGILPDEIVDRPKHGFAIPLGRWFRGRLGPFVRDLLLGPTSRRRGIFNLGYVERLIERHEQGRPLDLQLWTLVSFELWCRTFLDAPPRHATASDQRSRISVRASEEASAPSVS